MAPSKSALGSVLDRSALRHLAGARSFALGEDYAASGQVRALAERGGAITTAVRGTREYRVKLWEEDGDLEYSRTCPVGTDGSFCKHRVAVGLAWLEHGSEPGRGQRKAGRPAVTMDSVRAFLNSQEKGSLVDLLMAQSSEDDRLRQRLLMKAAKKSPKGLDLTPYRGAIDAAVDIHELVDYRGVYDYAQGIEEAIESIEELLKEGHAAEVIELAEHTLAAVGHAMGQSTTRTAP